MRILAANKKTDLKLKGYDFRVKLFGKSIPSHGYIGEHIPYEVFRKKLSPSPRAWDLVAIALAVFSADLRGHRLESPDGWTREFQLTVTVQDPMFWKAQKHLLERQL